MDEPVSAPARQGSGTWSTTGTAEWPSSRSSSTASTARSTHSVGSATRRTRRGSSGSGSTQRTTSRRRNSPRRTALRKPPSSRRRHRGDHRRSPGRPARPHCTASTSPPARGPPRTRNLRHGHGPHDRPSRHRPGARRSVMVRRLPVLEQELHQLALGAPADGHFARLGPRRSALKPPRNESAAPRRGTRPRSRTRPRNTCRSNTSGSCHQRPTAAPHRHLHRADRRPGNSRSPCADDRGGARPFLVMVAACPPRSLEISPRFQMRKRIGTDRAGLKVCERCHRRYTPRSNRQRWCKACRPEVDVRRGQRTGGVWFGFVPEERQCACCGRSFMARQPNMRFCCEWCRSRTPRPAEAEAARRLKYGTGACAAAEGVGLAAVRTGTVRCARGSDCVYAVDGVPGLILPGRLGSRTRRW